MWFLVIVAGIVGAFTGRAIVAEASAHRRGLPDRWWDPRCEECDGPVRITGVRCSVEGHPQRSLDVWTPPVTAGLFALVAATSPSPWVTPAYLVFTAAMVLLTVTDLDTKLIPNRILAPATIAAGLLLIVGGLAVGAPGALARAVGAGLAYFGVMFLLALVARVGLGFGDVKLAFLIGVFTGFLGLGSVVVAGVGAFLIGGVVAVVLLLTRRSSRKDAIPFGPFMTAAAIVAVTAGDAIVGWYLG